MSISTSSSVDEFNPNPFPPDVDPAVKAKILKLQKSRFW
jgi:hypothetical protein